ncbi:MAG: hypothetical protein GPJ54_09410 [Candidatus Heimdallarchaeota archaeon]|nr:hypothetical protein [Candidatus Heimdallarchaeota archaeon]
MASETTLARAQFKLNNEEKREERKDQILLFLKQNPSQSIYQIAKDLRIPRSSLPKLLDELIEEEEIKVKNDFSGKTMRKKKSFSVRTLDDFSFDNFTEINLQNKEFGKFTFRLMKSTLKYKGSFNLILSDKSVNKIEKHDDLPDKIKKLTGLEFK